MKKKLMAIAVSFIGVAFSAQVGVGTPTPDLSAMLDVKSRNKGFLAPRIALTSNTDQIIIPNPAQGLLVYNGNCSSKSNRLFFLERDRVATNTK